MTNKEIVKKEIINYILEKKAKLDNGEVDVINLKNIYPYIVEEVFGEIENYSINGWEGDYWGINTYYIFEGSMFYGEVTIQKREDVEEDCK